MGPAAAYVVKNRCDLQEAFRRYVPDEPLEPLSASVERKNAHAENADPLTNSAVRIEPEAGAGAGGDSSRGFVGDCCLSWVDSSEWRA